MGITSRAPRDSLPSICLPTSWRPSFDDGSPRLGDVGRRRGPPARA